MRTIGLSQLPQFVDEMETRETKRLSKCQSLVRGRVRTEITFLWYIFVPEVHFPSPRLIAVCFSKGGGYRDVGSNRLGVTRSSGRI